MARFIDRPEAYVEPVSQFALQFDGAQIRELAARFGDGDDPAALAAGAAAAARGYYRRAEFLRLCAWKTPRSGPRVAVNSPRRVRAATSTALGAEDEAVRMAALLTLDGVGVPTASTLLFFAYPERYPILDVRALEALGVVRSATYPVSFWLGYLEACRGLAVSNGVSMRVLDKALWQWSKEQAVVASSSSAGEGPDLNKQLR